MYKKIQALLANNRDLGAQAESLAQQEGDHTKELEQISDQITANNKQIAALERAMSLSKARATADDDAASAGAVEDGEEDDTADDEPDSDSDDGAAPANAKRRGRSWAKAIKKFAAAARRGFVRNEAEPDYNREGSDIDGGYTVPVDIVTRVNELKQTKTSLRDLVSVETVSTNRGRRTFKKRSQQSGFTKVGEGGKISRKSGPLFSVVEYIIQKFAGWLPATNELLADSDANVVEALIKWLADEGRATDNAQILEVIKRKTPVCVSSLATLTKTFLTGLDAAFRSSAKITTNSNGLAWLATLMDANDRPLLTPIPSDPGKMQLAFGASVVPVVEMSNLDLPDHAEGKPPFIIGDLKEGIRLFDRQGLTIKTSDVAMAGGINAYEEDMTLFRAIVRMDVQTWDEEAYIYAYLDTDASNSPAPALGELTVTSAAGADSGTTALTVSPSRAAGHIYKYKVGDAAMAVTAGQSVTSWSVWDGTSDVTAATGKVITLVEASADYKAVKAGTVTVTAKE